MQLFFPEITLTDMSYKELLLSCFKCLVLDVDELELFVQHLSESHLIFFSELTHNSWEMTLHSKLTSNILEYNWEKIQLQP